MWPFKKNYQKNPAKPPGLAQVKGSFMGESSSESLKFSSLDEVISLARRLEKEGYTRKGEWNLGQVCHHLACWLTYPVDGFPAQPLFVRWMLGIMRVTVGKSQLKKILSPNGMRAKLPTLPESVSSGTERDAVGVSELEKAIQKFKNHSGDYLPSPLFGRLDRETSLKLQLVHAGHHFSFLRANS